MAVSVERDDCIGSGQCVTVAPEVFDQSDDDGVVVLLDHRPPAGEHEGVREAADLCPAAAIRLHENGAR
ncbi:ferredoxin [Streptomyces sp. NPDC001985]|uniref:ferredoxin n=1 Tax=Streptomyces sp. NPDC001985 TaxID=3154406 RepID=UPI00333493A1